MDQQKIGAFLKQLRKEKEMTQEQLAEHFTVSARTVSRWETGSNMPDISLLIELAEFYDVDIREILNGERKSENMNQEVKETAQMVADYADKEKGILLRRAQIASIMGLISLLAGLIMINMEPVNPSRIYSTIEGICISFAFGAMIGLVFYTTGLLAQIRTQVRASKYGRWIPVVCIIFSAICFLISIIESLF